MFSGYLIEFYKMFESIHSKIIIYTVMDAFYIIK